MITQPDREICDAAFNVQSVQWREAGDPVFCEESNHIKSNFSYILYGKQSTLHSFMERKKTHMICVRVFPDL